MPGEERPAKLNELWELCGQHKLIPGSMNLQGYRDSSVGTKEDKGLHSVYLSEFEGQKVAVGVLRLDRSHKRNGLLSVSAVSRVPCL